MDIKIAVSICDGNLMTLIVVYGNLSLQEFIFSGSLSATSTIDSLSSSFLCNAANEVT